MIPLDSYCTGQARFVHLKNKNIAKDVLIQNVYIVGISLNGLVLQGTYESYIVQAIVPASYFYYWFWRDREDKIKYIPEPIQANSQWTEWKVIDGN